MIILTNLGTSEYEPATYQWGVREKRKAQLFAAALHFWYPTARVKALVTEEAENKNGLLLLKSIPDVERIPISKGQSDEENWELFDTIVEAVPEGEEVLFDVTHGFRSLPIVTLLALSFLRTARGVKVKGVVYGAFDRSRPEDEITPVFDLTPFLEMLDWANATKRLVETGDASRLKPLLEAEKASPFYGLAKPLATLSQALAFSRTREVAQLAQQVTQDLGRLESSSLPIRHKPFKLLMHSLKQSYAPLGQSESASAEQQLLTQYQHIIWYCRHKQFDSALTLAREWMVSVVLWKERGTLDVSNDIRNQAENKLKQSHTGSRDDQKWKAFRELWDGLSRLRNDIAHCGMRRGEIKTADLPSETGKLVKKLPAAVLPLGLTLEPQDTP